MTVSLMSTYPIISDLLLEVILPYNPKSVLQMVGCQLISLSVALLSSYDFDLGCKLVTHRGE